MFLKQLNKLSMRTQDPESNLLFKGENIVIGNIGKQ